jgi:hypothetical protein
MAALEPETTPFLFLIVSRAMISRQDETRWNPFRLKRFRSVKKRLKTSLQE